MSLPPTPYIGEIRMFAGNFAPVDWMFCEGQLLSISELPDLFNWIGDVYGGDGQETFALPDLRGRTPVHQGSGYIIRDAAGVESVTLTINQIPSHTHPLVATSSAASDATPQGALPAEQIAISGYQSAAASANMSAQAIGPAGGSQPHENMQPYLCINYIISLYGENPSPT